MAAVFPHTSVPSPTATKQLIGTLSDLASKRGLYDLATRLADLHQWVADDLRQLHHAMADLPRGASRVHASAYHLLDLAGKHLRPMCVVLAAKLGTGFDERAGHLAVAVELVHSATLLHDDVVDLGVNRRGGASARMVYGNAAAIFAGDWLLIQALKRIRNAAIPGVIDSMLDTIDEMILAESVQLENRGRINAERDDYFHVVEGKTASLFRWAMEAGARAGGLTDPECRALADYGQHLGIAFQAIDDLLDVDGDIAQTGKNLFADLREGKMTYPLILVLERDPEAQLLVERCARLAPEEALPDLDVTNLLRMMKQTGALHDCRQLALSHIDRAINALSPVRHRKGVDALVTIAQANIHRDN